MVRRRSLDHRSCLVRRRLVRRRRVCSRRRWPGTGSPPTPPCARAVLFRLSVWAGALGVGVGAKLLPAAEPGPLIRAASSTIGVVVPPVGKLAIMASRCCWCCSPTASAGRGTHLRELGGGLVHHWKRQVINVLLLDCGQQLWSTSHWSS